MEAIGALGVLAALRMPAAAVRSGSAREGSGIVASALGVVVSPKRMRSDEARGSLRTLGLPALRK